jgi:hypothetical protein
MRDQNTGADGQPDALRDDKVDQKSLAEFNGRQEDGNNRIKDKRVAKNLED